ncbi:MAG: hypothetical protein MUP63_03305 [Candidatus Nanohaloarchaeota archaeon QJJ-7]|nr:hypothetical protein [Candidatus Nanohaloarchaeota archaeon QJJ-7]
MNQSKAMAFPVTLFILLSGTGAAQPPNTPPGHMTEDMMSQSPGTWAVVGLSVLLTLAVLTAIYWFWFKDRETVTVETDEDKLLKVLDEKGGKTTQPVLKEETGWSASKISRVTDRLEDEGELEKLRLGRKNIVQRPDKSAGEND